ncbi:hypothetical protein R5R35_010010 [Gryllus longicercus]|uniref:Ubiquitin-like protease family profile domain-containing protein n=1 Tax=Gryllus longicercus TaxID=2509291 RepID=A0AAN9W041_9ORTH
MDRNNKTYVSSSGFSENDVISFHDSLLHKSDVDLLTGPYWLNDNLIGFYFEYLENVTFQGCDKLLFISPQVTQCLKMSNWRELFAFLDPLNFHQRDFVFLPVNDCDALEIPGGTHWSLLVLSKPENLFYHLDSCTGSNYSHAWQLGVNISKYMRKQVDFTESECLQQSNSYDCGIHVLCSADQLASHCIKENKILGTTRLNRSTIQAKRHQLLDLIKALKQPTIH